MSGVNVIADAVWQDTSPLLMAHAKSNPEGDDLVQADVGGITYLVYEEGERIDDTGAPLDDDDPEETLATTEVVFDDLQDWPEDHEADEDGYNVAFRLPAGYLAKGNKLYRVEMYVELTGGEEFPIVWEITTKNLYAR